MIPNVTHRIRPVAAAAVMALTLSLVPGCDAWQRMTGQPTQSQVDAAEKAYEEAERRVGEAEKARAELERQVDQAKANQARIDEQRNQLATVQSRIALELANAPESARPFFEAQLDALRVQSRALNDQTRAYAEAIAGYERDVAETAAAADATRAELARIGESLVAMQAQAKDAQKRAKEGIRGVGKIAGEFGVPAAGSIANTIADYSAPLFAIGTAVFGATTVRATRQRNAGRKAMAITERHGIEQIATDPAVKAAAKKDMKADRAVAAEYAIAKAMA